MIQGQSGFVLHINQVGGEAGVADHLPVGQIRHGPGGVLGDRYLAAENDHRILGILQQLLGPFKGPDRLLHGGAVVGIVTADAVCRVLGVVGAQVYVIRPVVLPPHGIQVQIAGGCAEEAVCIGERRVRIPADEEVALLLGIGGTLHSGVVPHLLGVQQGFPIPEVDGKVLHAPLGVQGDTFVDRLCKIKKMLQGRLRVPAGHLIAGAGGHRLLHRLAPGNLYRCRFDDGGLGGDEIHGQHHVLGGEAYRHILMNVLEHKGRAVSAQGAGSNLHIVQLIAHGFVAE